MDRWRRIEALFDVAVKQPPSDRDAYLRRACAQDLELYREVTSLLSYDADGTTDESWAARAAEALLEEGSRSPQNSPSNSSLAPGMSLGPYRITGVVGAGAMGEVYRARDSHLNRDVALKVLPEFFAIDPDRLARLRREAQVLASLNHQNIAAIYGFEDRDSIQALVLEFVDGPTLAQRIAHGPIPLDQALPIAKQIAEALEAAHEHGIIHRDLKPANIKVQPDGTVKLLDFGLAKALDPIPSTSDVSPSPPMPNHDLTDGGAILGTWAYMSPEQARGGRVDTRTDVWAFGSVLYEMLTGHRAFDGPTSSDVLANVLEREPDFDALPAGTPEHISRLLRRALTKDVRNRLHAIGDARLEVVEALATKSAVASSNTALEHERAALGQQIDAAVAAQDKLARRWRLRLGLVSAALVVLGITATTIVWYLRRPAAPPVTRTLIPTPGTAALTLSGFHRDLALTPDGRRVVYVGNNGSQLFVRALDALAPTPIVTGVNLRAPSVSADGRWIGFSKTGAGFWKVALTGGSPSRLTALDGATRGAAWAPDGTVIVATAGSTGLLRVPAADGGTPEVLTRPDRAAGEVAHLWPELLPGGTAVLFTITTTAGGPDAAQIAVKDLQTGAQTILVRGGSHAYYVRSGHLIYTAGGTLRAIGFDLGRRETRGTAVLVVPQVATTPDGAGNLAVTTDGTLVYVDAPGSGARRTLVWVDRAGMEEPLAAPARAYRYPRLESKGRRLVVRSADGQDDLWISEVQPVNLRQLTTVPGQDNHPLWTPNGQRIIFSSNRAGGAMNLWWQAADGTGVAERLTTSPNDQYATAITPDGKEAVFFEITTTGRDLRRLVLDASRPVTGLVETPADERNGVLSADGRWLAYESNPSGRSEIYVAPFPETQSGIWPISSAGGMQPLFGPRDTELFFLASDGFLMRVPVETSGTTFSFGTPTKLFDARPHITPGFVGRSYDVSPDGKRFLMTKAADEAGTAPPSLILVQHFDEELKRLVPTK